MNYIGRYGDRPSTLTVDHEYTENHSPDPVTGEQKPSRHGRVYHLNESKITVWDDGTVTAIRDRYAKCSPSAMLPNMTVEEGRISIPLEDLAGLILERVPADELARDLLVVDEVRAELLEGLARRWSSDHITDADRRKFLQGIQTAIYGVAVDNAVAKLNEAETTLRVRSSHRRWEKIEAHNYRRIYEWVAEHIADDPKKFESLFVHPDKFRADLQAEADPIVQESVGPEWYASRDYWRDRLESIIAPPETAALTETLSPHDENTT